MTTRLHRGGGWFDGKKEAQSDRYVMNANASYNVTSPVDISISEQISTRIIDDMIEPVIDGMIGKMKDLSNKSYKCMHSNSSKSTLMRVEWMVLHMDDTIDIISAVEHDGDGLEKLQSLLKTRKAPSKKVSKAQVVYNFLIERIRNLWAVLIVHVGQRAVAYATDHYTAVMKNRAETYPASMAVIHAEMYAKRSDAKAVVIAEAFATKFAEHFGIPAESMQQDIESELRNLQRSQVAKNSNAHATTVIEQGATRAVNETRQSLDRFQANVLEYIKILKGGPPDLTSANLVYENDEESVCSKYTSALSTLISCMDYKRHSGDSVVGFLAETDVNARQMFVKMNRFMCECVRMYSAASEYLRSGDADDITLDACIEKQSSLRYEHPDVIFMEYLEAYLAQPINSLNCDAEDDLKDLTNELCDRVNRVMSAPVSYREPDVDSSAYVEYTQALLASRCGRAVGGAGKRATRRKGVKKEGKATKAKWVSTGRKVAVCAKRGKPSIRKTVFQNTSTGVLRVRKVMVSADGVRKTSYVKY